MLAYIIGGALATGATFIINKALVVTGAAIVLPATAIGGFSLLGLSSVLLVAGVLNPTLTTSTILVGSAVATIQSALHGGATALGSAFAFAQAVAMDGTASAVSPTAVIVASAFTLIGLTRNAASRGEDTSTFKQSFEVTENRD